jgi:GNAT superfamily N-acetyltransferase
MRRNMPDPIPVIVLGRFAVDRDHQGKGIGAGMLRDALLRSLNVAGSIGVRAVLLHSLTEEARRFYMGHGFIESPLDPMTLMLPVETIRDALEPLD